MCLYRQLDIRLLLHHDRQVYYKVFRATLSGIYPMVQGQGTKQIGEGVWLDEKEWRDTAVPYLLYEVDSKTYPFGWHVFEKKTHAVNYARNMAHPWDIFIVRRVHIRTPVAYGIQGSHLQQYAYPCAVALDLFVIPGGEEEKVYGT